MFRIETDNNSHHCKENLVYNMDWNVGVMVDRCKVDTGQQRAVIVTAVAAVEIRVLVRVTGTRTGNRCLSRGLLKSSQHQKLNSCVQTHPIDPYSSSQ